MVVNNITVEKPRTAEELAWVLHKAAEANLAVAPVGGGRADAMGDVLQRCDVELHTTGLDRVIEHFATDMVVTVEAGITLEALQEHLAKSRQFLPLDPFNSPGHTVGGLLATGWTGPLRMRFGSARDFLIGIRVALPDGKLASAGGRVVKNVSGYDLMKLHIGAMGSLGVIVAASFKVFPTPLFDVTVGTDHSDVREAWTDVDRALTLPMLPAALEVYSNGGVAARFLGSRDAVRATVEDLGWDALPNEMWSQHAARSPKLWARITVPRSALRRTIEALGPYAYWYASAGVGVVNWEVEGGVAEIQSARAAAESAGGSLVLMAAPDDVKKKVGAWGTPPPTLDVMRRLKNAFDPNHVLNPGRFVV